MERLGSAGEQRRGQGVEMISMELNELELEEIWCGTLPDDVVLEILSRLPPKPFFRSKCVSKTWLALSSPAARRNKLLQPTLLGFLYDTQSSMEIGFTNISGQGGEVPLVDGALRALPDYDECDILACCNGLLLIACTSFGFSISSSMYVYNPATQKHTAIESLPWQKLTLSSSDFVDSRLYSLAFDPRNGLNFHVVCFMHYHDVHSGCANLFLTFSSDSRKWQPGPDLGCALKIAGFSNGTFLDGRVHCLTEGREIVSVNPINNSYLVTKFDFPGLSNKDFCEIGQSGGLLHFMYGNRRISIWVSKNGDLQKWIFKHRVSLEDMHFVHYSFQRIKLHPEKDVLLVHLENGHILSVELCTGNSDEICVLPHPTCPNFWPYTCNVSWLCTCTRLHNNSINALWCLGDTHDGED